MPADPVTLKLRYPAFASIADEVLAYWITDTQRIVTDAWFAADREPATLALAAHNCIMAGAGSKAGGAGIPAGVTRFKSASFEVQVSDAAVTAEVKGGYDATVYGQEFAVMLRRNRGGARLIGGETSYPGEVA